MKIIKAYAVNNLCYIANKKMKPQGIVVHSTGANNPFLKRYVDCPEKVGPNKYGNHWNMPKPNGQCVCVHAFIGYDMNEDIQVVEILPLDICCWGVGSGEKGSYNYNPAYIQFEICEDNLKNKEYYEKAFEKAVEYCAYLCEKFDIEVSNIVGHCEAHARGYGSNHSDPEHWMRRYNDSMETFRERISVVLGSNTEQKIVVEEFIPYRVKITADKLNIRKDAGTNYEKVGCITDYGVYTIIEEKIGAGASLWGRLKSKVGWISLDYVSRI